MKREWPPVVRTGVVNQMKRTAATISRSSDSFGQAVAHQADNSRLLKHFMSARENALNVIFEKLVAYSHSIVLGGFELMS